MIQTIKRYFAPALLSSLAALFFVVFFTGRDDTGLTTFRSECGWGYSVTALGKVVIWQPYIPAVEGMKPFEKSRDARRAGKIVVERLRNGEDPTLTREDLQKAGIGI